MQVVLSHEHPRVMLPHRFNIGVFPWAMICSLVLFLDPHMPAGIWSVLNNASPPVIPQAGVEKSKDDDNTRSDKGHKVRVFSSTISSSC